MSFKVKRYLVDFIETNNVFTALILLVVLKALAIRRKAFSFRHPVDLLIPITVVQVISMIVFLPSRNLIGHLLTSLISVLVAMAFGLSTVNKKPPVRGA